MTAHDKLIDDARERYFKGWAIGALFRDLASQVDQAARQDERERACKVVCAPCERGYCGGSDSLLLVEGRDGHWYHASGSYGFINCAASAIRALSFSPVEPQEKK